MTCKEILVKLLEYRFRLNEVLKLDEHTGWELSNAYSFITADIRVSDKQFAHIRFKVDDDAANLYEVYCEERSAEKDVRGGITAENWPGWRSPSTVGLPYSEEIIRSLETADRIAGLTKYCAAGDDYRPGNFSKVSVNGERIELQQINHMHAKSLDHKDNYSLRNLVFTIPFDSRTVIKKFDAYQVGNMIVEFSDRSSKNNRECGRKVIEEIEKLVR